MLAVRDLRAGYGAIEVLHGLDLDVGPGEIVVVLGRNGAGKTTALRAIAGLLRARSGQILLRGEDLTRRPPHERARRGLTLVPQGRGIFPDLSVAENLRMGGWTVNDEHELARRLDDAVSLFPLLRERAHQRAGTLSGGEQQQLAVARALVARPAVLMVDEPSLGLAPVLTRVLFDTLPAIAAGGSAVVVVEQQAALALSVADRGYVLDGGTVTAAGSSATLLTGRDLEASYLGTGTGTGTGAAGIPPADPTPEKVLVPLTAAEKRRLQAAAEAEGIPVGEVLRRSFLDRTERVAR